MGMDEMSRLSRLKEYADPMRGPHGAASSKENLDDWSARATENSKVAPRAKGGKMRLPSTGKAMGTRDTGMRPYAKRAMGDEVIAEAKSDKNNVGSSFMKSVRRDA